MLARLPVSASEAAVWTSRAPRGTKEQPTLRLGETWRHLVYAADNFRRGGPTARSALGDALGPEHPERGVSARADGDLRAGIRERAQTAMEKGQLRNAAEAARSHPPVRQDVYGVAARHRHAEEVGSEREAADGARRRQRDGARESRDHSGSDSRDDELLARLEVRRDREIHPTRDPAECDRYVPRAGDRTAIRCECLQPGRRRLAVAKRHQPAVTAAHLWRRVLRPPTSADERQRRHTGQPAGERAGVRERDRRVRDPDRGDPGIHCARHYITCPTGLPTIG